MKEYSCDAMLCISPEKADAQQLKTTKKEHEKEKAKETKQQSGSLTFLFLNVHGIDAAQT